MFEPKKETNPKSHISNKSDLNPINQINQNKQSKVSYKFGNIIEARKHRSANKPLYQLKNFTNDVSFCKFCNLPCEHPGIIEPFNCCDDIDKFALCDLSIPFYFYFFKFLIYIMFISICSICLCMMIFNKRFINDLNTICNDIYKSNNKDYLIYCEGFITETDVDINLYSRFMKDWIFTFSTDSLKIYQYLYKKITNEDNSNIEKIFVNYSLVNFIFLITIFIINIFFIILTRALTSKLKLETLSIGDYTVLISNARYILNNYFEQKKKENSTYINNIESFEKDNQNFINYLNTYIEAETNLNNLKINNINICYNIGLYLELRNELEKRRNKIFKIENDPRIFKINNEKGYFAKNRYYYKFPFGPIGCYCIKIKDKSLGTLERQNTDLEKLIDLEINNSQKLTEFNFTGYMFVTFENIKDKEKILKNYLNKKSFCCCLTKRKINKKFELSEPCEPEDVLWENFGNFRYNYRQRCIRIILYLLVCVIIMVVSSLIILLFTKWQKNLTKKEKEPNIFLKYLISIFINIIIAIANSISERVLEKWTNTEKKLSVLIIILV